VSPAADAPRPLRIVLVDDTPDLRLLLRAALQARGRFEVVGEAGDGAEGIEVARRLQPDVVLVDLAMPVLDGLDALPGLRQACPAARLVVHSGFESSRLLERACGAGADGYVQKGLDPWTLEDRLLALANTGGDARSTSPRPPADLVERAPYGVVTLTVPDGRLLTANDAARELLGGGDPPTVPAALVDAVHSHAHALLGHGRPIELVVDADGGSLRVTLTAAPHGVAAYLVPAAADDVAWLRSAVAGAVHEIRNPTVVIAGAVAALLAKDRTPARDLREELLAAIGRQARLLDRATADLLTAAQAHRGGVRVDPRPFALAEVLTSAVADSGVVAEVVCPTRLAVLADPLRVQQMVLNLLGNAAKYAAPPIVVEARPDGDSVRVTVADAGPGVPPHLAGTLFEEFTRAPRTGVPGTGLGLFVVRSLAGAQGGRAWHEPAPEGGAVFGFTLPAAPPAQQFQGGASAFEAEHVQGAAR
jgi:CheY-like chemotaxis protein